MVRGGDLSSISFFERLRDWFKLAHLNFHWLYPWVLLAPYVVWLASRFHVERGRLHISLPVHLVACILFALASQAINSRVANELGGVVFVSSRQELKTFSVRGEKAQSVRIEYSGAGAALPPGADMAARILSSITNKSGTGRVWTLKPELTGGVLTNFIPRLGQAMNPVLARMGIPRPRPLSTLLDLLTYGSLVGIAHAVHFYGRYRERERRAMLLESSLAKARLHALQAQLHPHFLFNTLNAIATLLRRDPRAAEATLTSLSELLRLALSQSEKQELTLREEVQFLERYLEIQQTRFGDRLRFEQQVEPAALDCLVPTLLLQPLVENAIRHGIEPSGNPGLVRVTARQQDSRLALSVEDDGVGLSQAVPMERKPGIGLSNLRARLQALYGESQKLELVARPQGGVAVRVEIPWRPAPLEGSGRRE